MSAKQWLDQIEGDLFKTRELETPARRMFGALSLKVLLDHKEQAIEEGEADRWEIIHRYVVDYCFDGKDPTK